MAEAPPSRSEIQQREHAFITPPMRLRHRQLVGGWIADRFGTGRTLTVCALVWSITTMATGAVIGLVSLFAARFVLGMGEGATLPAATRALSNWTSPPTPGFAVGVLVQIN